MKFPIMYVGINVIQAFLVGKKQFFNLWVLKTTFFKACGAILTHGFWRKISKKGIPVNFEEKQVHANAYVWPIT